MKTWLCIFSSSKCCGWKDTLTLVELLFTIPVSNTKIEPMFSILKYTKTNFQASLNADRMESLLHILEQGPTPENYDIANAASYCIIAKIEVQIKNHTAITDKEHHLKKPCRRFIKFYRKNVSFSESFFPFAIFNLYIRSFLFIFMFSFSFLFNVVFLLLVIYPACHF